MESVRKLLHKRSRVIGSLVDNTTKVYPRVKKMLVATDGTYNYFVCPKTGDTKIIKIVNN